LTVGFDWLPLNSSLRLRFTSPDNFARDHAELARYYFYAVSPTNGFAARVQTAFDQALSNEGEVASEVLSVRGMSGKKYRRFISNLMEVIPNPRYLEIGAWQGSTLCSAILGNEITTTCVDNWSEFKPPFDKFLTNLAKFKGNLG
jgi:hypothetical protein